MEAIVVTGASSGIGYTTALLLAEKGFVVFSGVRKEADRQRLACAHEGLHPIVLDVTVPADVARAIETVRTSGHPLRAVVNNAGIALAGPLEFLPLEALRNQFEVNVLGPLAMTQAALPLLRETRGRAIFIGSIAGRLSAPFVGPYSASKSALAMLVDALRQELYNAGIGVSLLEFAAVKTPIWEKGRARKDELVAQFPPHAIRLYGKYIDAIVEQTRREEAHGMEPIAVAQTVLHAICASRPRARYVVGKQARIQSIAAFLPPRTRDRLVRRAMRLP